MRLGKVFEKTVLNVRQKQDLTTVREVGLTKE
jgi:hypothetical protein